VYYVGKREWKTGDVLIDAKRRWYEGRIGLEIDWRQ
jgi:hypothetical protein